ncbi:MAG: class I SAM-dependent methyltransferase [Nevskia sp.]|nr:class I SAM-dependent methyltransferase [Nevskia sp.]
MSGIMRYFVLLGLGCLGICLPPAFGGQKAADPGLAAAVADPGRTPEFRARDRYRHPLQTLRFFGIRPDMTVVEIWPGRGWYSEILAPYLKDKGHLYAAVPQAGGEIANAEVRADFEAFSRKFTGDAAHYGSVTITQFKPPEHVQICPPGSADLVLTFRNVHNWIAAGYEQDAFKAFYAALKPGGVLGVVEHRARPYTTLEQTRNSGYVNEAYIKALAANAGFRFAGASPVNDNPKDTKDYPEGVWTLPPTLTLGGKDKAKYLAIGESDRMTLKFVKP